MSAKQAVLILTVVLSAAAGASADVLTTADGKEHTAEVLKVTDAGVVVKTPDGEQTYPFDELEAQCAYRYMQRTIDADSAEDRIKLAKYCLKRKLLDEAKSELTLAVRLDPKLENEVKTIWAEATAAEPPRELTPEETARVVAEQRARREQVQAAAGQKVYTLETDHFIIHTTFAKQEHQPLEELCEKLYRGFDRIFEISDNKDRMWDGKCVMYFFKDRGGFVKFAVQVHHFPGYAAGGYFRARGGQCEVVIPKLKGPERFKETMVHEGAHAFLHFYREKGHIPTWVHEGVAQHFQFEEFPKSSTLRTLHRIVRDGVRTGTTLRLKELAASRRPSLGTDLVGYAYAYSYVSYMIHRSPKNFARFIRALKAGKEAEDALREAYDLDFAGFEKRWFRAVAAGL